MSSELQKCIIRLENLELLDKEIERLSEFLELSDAINNQDIIYEQAVKNLGFEYLFV